MELIPLYDRVLVKRDPTPSLSAVLWVPNQKPEDVNTGTVIACGPGFRDDKGVYHQLSVAKGDKVAFLRQAGTNMKVVDQDLVMVREFELLGKLAPTTDDHQVPLPIGDTQ